MTGSNTPSTNHFTSTTVRFTILSGHSEVNVLLPSTDDIFVEEDEVLNVTLTLKSGCCMGSPASIQIRIIDDDGKYILVILYKSLYFDREQDMSSI